MRMHPIGPLVVVIFAIGLAWPAPARADGNGIVALAPQPQDHVKTSTPAIVAKVDGVTPKSGKVHMLVDGRDVSDTLTIAGQRVSYKPAAPLGGGLHAVELDVDNGSGSRLSYQWSFSVDEAAATRDSAAARAAQPVDQSPAASAEVANPGPEFPSYPPLNAALGDSGPPFGYPNFGLYALNQSPFYWGQNVPFVFNGAAGGNGFLTVGGIPGFFNLVPVGSNIYYVIVPIPVGYGIANPPIVAHFFTPHGTPVVFPYRRHLGILARRAPMTTRMVAALPPVAMQRRALRTSALRSPRPALRSGYGPALREAPRPRVSPINGAFRPMPAAFGMRSAPVMRASIGGR